MSDELWRHRKRLLAIAYRMLGSAAEAEDVVQDAWLRQHGATGIENPEAWLTTTVTRLCLDRLKSARHQREVYVGPWLPEPMTTTPDEIDPESISLAFLLLLERLTPVERAVYLLQRVFDFSHPEIAAILGHSEAAVRQSLHRATQHLATDKPRFAPSRDRHVELLSAFAMASQGGDLTTLKTLLADDAKLWSDGGGKVRAALNVITGGDAIARFLVGITRKFPVSGDAELRELNGLPSLVVWHGDHAAVVLSIETDGDQIFAVHSLVNPDKLALLSRDGVPRTLS